MARMLESEEAARRLGVKVTTLYAYVSRGLLASHPAPSGRRSLFDMDEVERLARRSRQGKAVETRMVTITTGITQLTDDGPVYRGLRATELATDGLVRGGGRMAVGRHRRARGGRRPRRRRRGHGVAEARRSALAALPLGRPPDGRILGPHAVGPGDGRCPRSPPGRPPARGGHPHGPGGWPPRWWRPCAPVASEPGGPPGRSVPPASSWADGLGTTRWPSGWRRR